MDNNIRNEYLEGRFEQTEDGVYFPRSRTLAQGVFSVNKRGEPVEYSPNLVVNQGLNYLLTAAVYGSANYTWYIALYSAALDPDAGWTGTSFDGAATEWTAYTHNNPSENGLHPRWDIGAPVSGAVDSFSAKAEFTSTVNGAVINGAALMSTGNKPATSGTLIAASRFPSVKNLDIGEVLDVGYGLTLSAV